MDRQYYNKLSVQIGVLSTPLDASLESVVADMSTASAGLSARAARQIPALAFAKGFKVTTFYRFFKNQRG